MKVLLASLFLLLSPGILQATNFYVDPINGSMENDGSQDHPWSTMSEVWARGKIKTTYTVGGVTYDKNIDGPVQPGDTIYLLSGFHGTLSITGARNTDWISVKAAPGARPYLHKIYGLGVSKWLFEGLDITPTSDPTYVLGAKSTLVYIGSNNWYGWSENITIKNCSIYTIEDSSGWSDSTMWSNYPYSGVVSLAKYTTIDGCSIKNVSSGVRLSSNDYPSHYSTIRNTTIDHTSLDPIWVFYSDNVLVENNTVKNVIGVQDRTLYHYDIIQSAASDYLTIRNNTLIANENGVIPAALIPNCQGIGLFDGWYDNTVIENNVVSVNSYHGISVYGATNSKVVNNTVVYNPYSFWEGGPSSAQIGFFDHKTGGAGSNNLLRNNVCTSIRSISAGTVADHNAVVAYMSYTSNFVDASVFNYNLIAASGLINLGAVDNAPTTDKDGNARGPYPDIGAYEYETLTTICSPETLSFCTENNCHTEGGGYWWDGTCHSSPASSRIRGVGGALRRINDHLIGLPQ